MILMTLQLVVTQTCCEAKLSPYSLHWNRYTFGLCYCGLFSYTIIGTFFHWGFCGASFILIKSNFFTWNMLMLERHFRKTRAKRRDAASTVTKSNIVWTSWQCSLLKNLGPPWQNQEYPHPSSQDSESSCFWHYLKYFLWNYKNQISSKFACNQIQLNLWDGNWVHRRQWGNRRGSRPSRLIL